MEIGRERVGYRRMAGARIDQEQKRSCIVNPDRHDNRAVIVEFERNHGGVGDRVVVTTGDAAAKRYKHQIMLRTLKLAIEPACASAVSGVVMRG